MSAATTAPSVAARTATRTLPQKPGGGGGGRSGGELQGRGLGESGQEPLRPRSSAWARLISSGSGSAAAVSVAESARAGTKVVAKCLVYDDDYFTLPSAVAPAPHPNSMTADGLATQEDDLAPLLELPDPDVVSGDTSSTSVVSAVADDALTASADSCVTEVPARADSATDTEAAAAALPEEINLALAELRGAGGLSPRSKRLLAALAEAAALELAPAATTARRLRLRRAGFWGKVRVAVLAGTLAAVAAADIAVAGYLYARRANERYGHALLPPT